MDVGPAPHSEGTRDLLNFVVVVVCFPFHTHWVTAWNQTHTEPLSRDVHTSCYRMHIILCVSEDQLILLYTSLIGHVYNCTQTDMTIFGVFSCNNKVSCTDKVSGGAGWLMEPRHWYGQGQKTTWLCCACTNNRRLLVVAVAPWCLNYVKLCCGSVCFAYCLLSVYLVQDAALHLTL